MNNPSVVAVIMAGGSGQRFWPKSRALKPKQFLSLFPGEKTLIQQTVERILPIVPIDSILVITNEQYKSLVAEQLPQLPPENIVCEPCPRNTAPAIALGAQIIKKRFANPVMAVVSSDHIIKNDEQYRIEFTQAVKLAEADNNLVTIGIIPDHPETEYGYLCCQGNKVLRFVEKPDLKTAEEYVRSKNFLWNSGIFFWKTTTILEAFKELLPELFQRTQLITQAYGSKNYAAVLEKEFARCPAISIDYGIMEKATSVYTVPGTFGWNDAGNWAALGDILPADQKGNTVTGFAELLETENSVVYQTNENKLIAAIGIKDLIIVDTSDALLVCAKNHTKNIKILLEQLKSKNKTTYL